MERVQKILTNVEKCNGCRTCELSCSFYLTKTFDPSRSRIQVKRNIQEKTEEVLISPSCNGCPDEKVPMCVRFCTSGCLSLEIS